MPDRKYQTATIDLPDELYETIEVLGQLLQNECKSIKIDLEHGKITSFCNLAEGEPLIPQTEPDLKGLFDSVELETVSTTGSTATDTSQAVLQALQLLSTNGFKAIFWVADAALDLKAKLGWPSLVSLRSGFLGLPLYQTDLREYSDLLAVYGTRLQGASLTSAQFGVLIYLGGHK